MTREELAMDLLQTLGLATWNDETQTDDVDSSQVTAVLAAFDAVRESAWIRCDEQMPDRDRGVAFFIQLAMHSAIDSGIRFGYWHTGLSGEDAWIVEDSARGFPVNLVTHWMPIASLPK